VWLFQFFEREVLWEEGSLRMFVEWATSESSLGFGNRKDFLEEVVFDLSPEG
jgi:hypothetical protein